MDSHESLSRLELRTHLDNPPEGNSRYWVVKYHNLFPGYLEAGFCQLEERPRCGTKKRKKTSPEINEEYVDRAIRRAKTTMRRKIMASGCDRLLTLTYRENIQDEKKAWQHWSKFIRIVKKKYNKDFKYIVVTELQKRGAIHFHAAINGYQNVKILRKMWLDIVGSGNIDITHGRSKQLKKQQLVSYLTKYIKKDMEKELTKNKKRFRTSQHIEWETRTYYLPVVLGKISPFIIKVFTELGLQVLTWWESEEGKPIGYAASYR